ncbi:MAG: 5-formyltetrahydrofolate cyclo-ligase [Desulfobulbaceae bacterium]|nr:5-formyltetrahydrofolate cyclo-ligase [Desulfobulbaceae bacterium]
MTSQSTDYRTILRKDILAKRDKLDPSSLEDRSREITARVLDHPLVLKAHTIFVYAHFRSEVRTLSLIHSFLNLSKKVVLPLTLTDQKRLVGIDITDPENQLEPGYCGIPEPRKEIWNSCLADTATVDVVIAPGSVFDARGGRLGYGGGYYDRFFIYSAPQAIRIGIAFEIQVVDHVPMLDHDQFMDYLITEKKTYDCGRKRYA